MAKANIQGVIDGVQGVLKALETLAPAAESLGVPSAVASAATIAIAATGIVQNVLERADNLKEALSSQDETKLRAMLSDLQAVNDRLAGQVAAS